MHIIDPTPTPRNNHIHHFLKTDYLSFHEKFAHHPALPGDCLHNQAQDHAIRFLGLGLTYKFNTTKLLTIRIFLNNLFCPSNDVLA